jgi:glycyl-tRNA synthetase beta chain
VPELLFEILSEEIPARMQAKAADDLKRLVCDRLQAAGLTFTGAGAFVTPRRLALVVEGLPERQPDITEEKKGPKVGAPEAAVAGFLKANDLASIDEAEVRETAKGPAYFAVRHVRGQPSEELLPGLLVEAIRACPWPIAGFGRCTGFSPFSRAGRCWAAWTSAAAGSWRSATKRSAIASWRRRRSK